MEVMSGHGSYVGTCNLKYFRSTINKKDPSEDKELYSIRLSHYRRLYPS